MTSGPQRPNPPDSTFATLGLLGAFGGSFSVTTLLVLAAWFGSLRPSEVVVETPAVAVMAVAPEPTTRTVAAPPERAEIADATDTGSPVGPDTESDAADAPSDPSTSPELLAEGPELPELVPVKPETKPAPVAKTKPAPVAKTKPAPVAKTKPAPVAKTKPSPVAKTKPAPVAKPATVAKTKTAPDPGSAKDTDAVAVLAGSIRLKSDDASTASVGTSAVKPPPSIAATALDGQYLGRTSGRPLTLTLTFSGEDSVTAEAKVTSGGTTSAQALSGTYALATDGSASVVLFEQETDSPWVYSGSVSNDTFSGRITIAGKDRGKFNARR